MRSNRLSTLSNDRGFTLIEIMASLVILFTIVAATFSVIYGVIQTSSAMELTSSRQQELNGLYSLLNSNLRSLPPSATLTYGLEESFSDKHAVLRISNSPQSFTWGGRQNFLMSVFVGVQEDGSGALTLGLARSPQTNRFVLGNKIKWLPLVKDIKEIRWRFFNPRSQRWQDFWNDTTFRPSLIELNFILMDQPNEPQRFVFWIPPVEVII